MKCTSDRHLINPQWPYNSNLTDILTTEVDRHLLMLPCTHPHTCTHTAEFKVAKDDELIQNGQIFFARDTENY